MIILFKIESYVLLFFEYLGVAILSAQFYRKLRCFLQTLLLGHVRKELESQQAQNFCLHPVYESRSFGTHKTNTKHMSDGQKTKKILQLKIHSGLDHSVRNCASSDCMGHVIATGRTCYTFDGDPLNLRSLMENGWTPPGRGVVALRSHDSQGVMFLMAISTDGGHKNQGINRGYIYIYISCIGVNSDPSSIPINF